MRRRIDVWFDIITAQCMDIGAFFSLYTHCCAAFGCPLIHWHNYDVSVVVWPRFMFVSYLKEISNVRILDLWCVISELWHFLRLQAIIMRVYTGLWTPRNNFIILDNTLTLFHCKWSENWILMTNKVMYISYITLQLCIKDKTKHLHHEQWS